ncbi:MAG: class I SAM-dependent methyltransferase [Cyclobacteriaceae bacterium]|nr:class I SAM-dependent methyltransferase [Cyclobacteriaceae bacterium]
MNNYRIDGNGISVLESTTQVDYPESGHSESIKFEDGSFWFLHRNKVICEVLQKISDQGNFVDIGGGNGLQATYIKRQFPKREVALVEPGYAGCLNAKRRGIKHVYNSLFQNFDFINFNTQAVGLFDVIEHIENDAGFILQLSKQLEKGTKILITVPAYKLLWSDLDDYGNHHRRYNKKMILYLAAKANLKILYFSHFFSYLVPLTFLLRTLPYLVRGGRSNEKILKAENKQHKPSGFIDWIFSFLSKMEMRIIKRSNLSFGASIVVALEVQ